MLGHVCLFLIWIGFSYLWGCYTYNKGYEDGYEDCFIDGRDLEEEHMEIYKN